MMDVLAVRINDAAWFKPFSEEFPDRTPAVGARWITEAWADELDYRWKLAHMGMYQWLADDRTWSQRMIEGMSQRYIRFPGINMREEGATLRIVVGGSGGHG